MHTTNKVFIASSLDGFISDKNGELEWLNSIPNPKNIDMGYANFMNQIDAIVMGRITFETVCNFDIDWPYNKPVFVLSRSLQSIPDAYSTKAERISGLLENVLKTLNQRGYKQLYIDGGTTIQYFLKEDLIDEITITTLPILLGGGSKLFTDLPNELKFTLKKSQVFLNAIVQSHYIRKR